MSAFIFTIFEQHKAEPGKLEFHETISSLKKIVDKELGGTSAVIAIGTGSIATAKAILDAITKIKFIVLGGTGSDNVGRFRTKIILPFNAGLILRLLV